MVFKDFDLCYLINYPHLCYKTVLFLSAAAGNYQWLR